ncbi:MAG: hypothetical protein OEM02_10525 [Desulfobulbaceae bacterium]|nr:hypothetical protein [Desulfobulbaceae bacterium]
MVPSSALRQGLHTTSMRPLARLEDETLSCAIRVDYFLLVPLFPVKIVIIPHNCPYPKEIS